MIERLVRVSEYRISFVRSFFRSLGPIAGEMMHRCKRTPYSMAEVTKSCVGEGGDGDVISNA